MEKYILKRRSFIKSSALTATGLMIGFSLNPKNSLASKKNLFRQLQTKSSVDKLVKILSLRYEKRNGGYSRVMRAGYRFGDDAPMAVIELIDRDIQAKKIDIKNKLQDKEVKAPQIKNKDSEKESKSKK